MYKNLYKDEKMAFIVDEVLGQGANGSDLVVTWYQQTDNGRYISIGIDGEFHIPKDSVMYYMEI
jgi:hypothetical protein